MGYRAATGRQVPHPGTIIWGRPWVCGSGPTPRTMRGESEAGSLHRRSLRYLGIVLGWYCHFCWAEGPRPERALKDQGVIRSRFSGNRTMAVALRPNSVKIDGTDPLPPAQPRKSDKFCPGGVRVSVQRTKDTGDVRCDVSTYDMDYFLYTSNVMGRATDFWGRQRPVHVHRGSNFKAVFGTHTIYCRQWTFRWSTSRSTP